jgi:hypothetical protein
MRKLHEEDNESHLICDTDVSGHTENTDSKEDEDNNDNEKQSSSSTQKQKFMKWDCGLKLTRHMPISLNAVRGKKQNEVLQINIDSLPLSTCMIYSAPVTDLLMEDTTTNIW